MRHRFACAAAAACSVVVLGCQTAHLSSKGANVATSSTAPVDAGWDPASCTQLGYVVGRGGGSFGGGWISNEELVRYAMNDLRNKAAALGANYVQHDSPGMGQSGSGGATTTSTATVSGTAYRCTQKGGATVASAARPSCIKGVTQACTGPGGCTGGQACLPDGSGFGACDCGGASSATAGDCDPPCSPGFTCVERACKPSCNPECARSEVCRADRTCGPPF